MSRSAASTPCLNTSRDGDSTTSLGSPAPDCFSQISCQLYFKSSWQGIGKSFQSAIIAPQIDLTGYDAATANPFSKEGQGLAVSLGMERKAAGAAAVPEFQSVGPGATPWHWRQLTPSSPCLRCSLRQNLPVAMSCPAK